MTPKLPGAGRPPTGLRGEKISQVYPTVTIRVPPEVRASMTIVVKTLNQPLWRILVDAYKAYIGEGQVLDEDKRLDVRYAKRLAAEKARRAAKRGGA